MIRTVEEIVLVIIENGRFKGFASGFKDVETGEVFRVKTVGTKEDEETDQVS